MNKKNCMVALSLALVACGPSAIAQEPSTAPPVEAAGSSPSSGPSADELAKQLSNPVSSLISLPFQQNVDFGYDHDGWRATLNVQPVMPFSISEDWNVISRTIIPFIYQDDVSAPGESESGIGDVIQSFFFSPKEPTESGWIWGAGPVIGIPIGSDDFTSDRWLAGPTAVALKQQDAWTYGALVNHVWDFAGSGSADVSATFLQPFASWGGMGSGQTITVNSESTYDWEGEQWTVPVNLLYSKVSKIGKQMVSYSVGGRVYLDRPSGGPDWGIRAVITLLFPK